MPIIIVPVPLMALALGFAGGYAAEKFIQHVEPAIDRKIAELQARKAMRNAEKARA